MMLKDNNFISAVVYLHNDGARAVEFCRTVAAELDANFKQYERRPRCRHRRLCL